MVAAACGDGSNKESRVTPKSSCPVDALASAKKPVEITYWHAMTRANEDELKKLTSQFNAQQHDVHVTLSAAASYPDNFTRFRAGLGTGVLPDLYQGADTTLQALIDTNSVLPVASCVAADHASTADLIDRVAAYYTVKNVLWAMPFNESNQVLYYNKAAFRRAGIDPAKPPTTLDELRTASQKIVQSGAARYGIALKNDVYFEHWLAHAGHTLVDHGNGRDARAGAVTFDDQTGRSLFGWVNDMVKSKLALNTGTRDLDHYFAVGRGEAAMTIDSSAALGTISQLFSAGQYKNVELGVGPMPAMPSPDGGELVGGAASYIVNRSTPDKQAAAYAFAKFLTSAPVQSEWAAATGYVPVSKTAASMPPLSTQYARKPEYKVAYDELLAGANNAATAGPVVGAYGAKGEGVRGAIIDAWDAMLSGRLTPDQAVAQAAQQANAAIEEYNARVG